MDKGENRHNSSGAFKLLKIPLPVILLLFGLYAWAFLLVVETSRRAYRRIRGIKR